eukprot:scaffold46857_cov18-Tisochrysis_lutea.AAC.1
MQLPGKGRAATPAAAAASSAPVTPPAMPPLGLSPEGSWSPGGKEGGDVAPTPAGPVVVRCARLLVLLLLAGGPREVIKEVCMDLQWSEGLAWAPACLLRCCVYKPCH